MSLLDCPQKIDMGLMSGNQFGLLGDNGNPNRLKPKAWLWFPIHQIKKQFLLSPSEENEGPIKEEGDLVEEGH